MQLFQILLPCVSATGKQHPESLFEEISSELAERFGGVTAFVRTPAQGKWKKGSDVINDDIVIFEVMTDEGTHQWWSDYRKQLETRFEQEEILIRSTMVQKY